MSCNWSAEIPCGSAPNEADLSREHSCLYSIGVGAPALYLHDISCQMSDTPEESRSANGGGCCADGVCRKPSGNSK
jgi:hypothetical protein